MTHDTEPTLARLLAESDRDLVPVDGWWCVKTGRLVNPDDRAACHMTTNCGPHRALYVGPELSLPPREETS